MLANALLVATLPAFHSAAGFGLTLPAGFGPLAGFAPGASAALAPASLTTPVQVAAVFVDDLTAIADGGDPDDQASLALSVVEAPFPADRGAPEQLAALAIDYCKDRLDAALHIEFVDRVPVGALRAVEVAGRLDLDEGERMALFAFVPFGARQLVLTASMPPSRFATLGPRIETALQTLTFDAPPKPFASHRAELGAALGAGLGVLVALTRLLWRRRGRFLTPPKAGD